jgi:transcription elongation factor Elf1/endogenous inhibitor of DNA gyrase (YacG/DUF329 family)
MLYYCSVVYLTIQKGVYNMTVDEIKHKTQENEQQPLGAELTCAICGTKFIKKTRKHKFCSTPCKGTYKQLTAARITAICQHCGKTFTHIKDSKEHRFCSSTCGSLAAGVPTKICTCVDCGIKFEFKGRTKKLRCDTCRKKWNSLQVMLSRQRKNPGIQIGVGSGGTQKCNLFLEDPVKREARLAKRRAKYHANIEKSRQQATHKARKYVLENDFSCVFCGYNHFKEGLCVHHINTNRSDNRPENLLVLCANCHQYFHQRLKQLSYSKEIDPEYELKVWFKEQDKKVKTIANLLEKN